MSEMSLTPKARAKVIADAQTKGYIVHQGSPTTLLLDLDTEDAIAQYETLLPTLKQFFSCTETFRCVSISGNLHAIVTLRDPQPVFTRIALQAALGSDGKKELLSVARALNGIEEPSLLFQPTPGCKPWKGGVA